MTNYYKRYIYKKGVKHGPYYYSNKKVNGRVISTYLGTKPPKDPEFKKPSKLNIKVLIFVLSIVSFGLLIYLSVNLNLFSTGQPIRVPEATSIIGPIGGEEVPITNGTNISGFKPKIIQKSASENKQTINTVQGPASIGEPVSWEKEVKLTTKGPTKILVPTYAENIVVYKVDESGNKNKVSESSIKITAKASVEIELDQEDSSIVKFFKKIIAFLTGKAVDIQTKQDIKEIIVNENSDHYAVEYTTPAPTITEEETDKGKTITVSNPELISYANVLTSTTLDEKLNIQNPESVKIYWLEQSQYIQPEKIEDKNNNGIYDYVEFTAPLSNQTYEIIVITKAEHLDSNKVFISDIYDKVKELDDVWSETINDNEYIRVTFEKNLTSSNDITLYPKVVSGSPKIEVYEKDKDVLIAEFSSLIENEYNQVLLTNLQEEQDTFDLKVLGGSIGLDHVVDPSTVILVNADASNTATGVTRGIHGGGHNLVRVNNGNLIASWEDASNDHSCSYSINNGTTWAAYSSESGTHGDVALATNGSTVLYVHTDELSSAYDMDYIYRNVEGICDIATGAQADISAITNDNIRPDVAYDQVHNRFVGCSQDNDDWDIDFVYATVGTTLTWTGVGAISGATTSDSCSIDVNDNGNVFIASDDSGVSAIRVYNSSAGVFATTTAVTAYNAAVKNMHMSIRGTEILITAIDAATSDLVVIRSSDGRTYTNVTYPGTFLDAEGCLDANGNSHIAFVNGTILDYIRYTGTSFDKHETITNTGTERYPSVLCQNFPANNRLMNNRLDLVFTDTGTNIYFANITLDTSAADITPPSITNANRNTSLIIVNNYFCLNATATDSSGVNSVLAQVYNTTAFLNYTMAETGGSCSGTGSDGVYGVEVNGTAIGIWNYSKVFANDLSDNWNSYDFVDLTINVTSIGNQPPTIDVVGPIPDTMPIENNTVPVNFIVQVSDLDGYADISNVSAKFNYLGGGEAIRNGSCTFLSGAGNTATYDCTVLMQYYDLGDIWNVNITAKDLPGNLGINNTSTFNYGFLTAMAIISPAGALTWPILSSDDTNISSTNDPVIFTNTGNQGNNPGVTAHNLTGETDPSELIPTTNFWAAVNNGAECGNTQLKESAVWVAGSYLPKGSDANPHPTEEIYFCLRNVPPISSQNYSAKGLNAWIIGI